MPANLPQREEYLRKKRNKRLWKYGIVIFLLVLIFGISSYVAHRPQFTISAVELSGGVLVKQEDLTLEALKYLEGSYFWLFPKRAAFLYPKKQLENHLKESFKRIDTISITSKDFRTLSILITEREPFATWCEGLPAHGATNQEGGSTEANTPKCYFMDSNSTIFASAPNFSGDAYFTYYGLVEKEDPIGSFYIASASEFAEIANFVLMVKKFSLRPQYLVAKGDGDFSLAIGGGGEIYFDTKKPLENVAQNLEALLQTPALATSTGANLNIEYVDLRYGNKLFYKLKNP